MAVEIVSVKDFMSKFPYNDNVEELKKLNLLPPVVKNDKTFRTFVKILGLRFADGCLVK